MLIGILSSVPEMPQEVALSEQVVTSLFVTWRPPPGQVEGYKVRLVYYCISPVPGNNHRLCTMMCVLVICLTQTLLKTCFFFQGQMRPLASASALTCWLSSNCCQHTTDLVTNPLKMYDLRRAPARKNDQAHYVHTIETHTKRNN